MLVRRVDLRPLSGGSGALSPANAPHASRYGPGLRAARAVPCLRERRGSDADAAALAAAACQPNGTRDRVAISQRLAVSGDEPSNIAVGESVSQSVSEHVSETLRKSICVSDGVFLAERFARLTDRLAFGIPRGVGIPDARSDAVTGGARSRAGA